MKKQRGHNNFNMTEISEVWASVPACAGYKTCIDPWGRQMNRDEYGKKSEFGWNIDHVKPISAGGLNDERNLQPLHWKSNKQKGDKNICEKWSRC
jgi:5-methylcytosine-specific restriction endonuclease McrA